MKKIKKFININVVKRIILFFALFWAVHVVIVILFAILPAHLVSLLRVAKSVFLWYICFDYFTKYFKKD